ncbi:hypothetical protein P8610_18080 [Fictibacillus sp. UD]|uniref:hypothetical protein n=1 Tax=Fictibacillus sp. UD TaxID=3038777 RepID=UPI003745910C
MSIEFQRKLEHMNRLQRKGVDQEDNYRLLFDENSKVVEMAKINAHKEKVRNGAFYLSCKKSDKADEYLVIDMFEGQVYKVNKMDYRVKIADDNILVTDKATKKEKFLIVKGKLDFGEIKYLGIKHYTYFSGGRDFKGVPAVRFNNSYKYSIRVHWIIALMRYGIETMNKCVGNSPVFRLRHKVAYKKSADNSIRNLHILTGNDDDNIYRWFDEQV